ncbi:MAG: radical SAM protein [Magnetococcales bacterium]|nr:radical SAM protein [Magnetococcales bacterium]
MKNILLLNLPSEIPNFRNLHRAKVGDPNYILPTADLIYISGFLWDAGFHLKFKDFQLKQKMTLEAYLAQSTPDIIVTTYSPFLQKEDLSQLEKIAANHPEITLILLASHKDRLDPTFTEQLLRKYRFITGMVVDYAFNTLASFLKGDRSEALYNVMYLEDELYRGNLQNSPKEFSLPIPRHELFKSDHYFHYDGTGGHLTIAMTNFGCKQPCSFCWAPQLYATVSDRSPENLVDEMEHIVRSGFDEVYFHDYTFGYHRKHLLRFCKLMVDRGIKLRWFCSARIDLMSPQVIKAMAEAGCRCIEFGIESGNYDVRKLYGKDFTDEKTKTVINLCRENGIHTSAYLILGLPEENLEDMDRSIQFVANLKVNYIALNILWAEEHTDLVKDVRQEEEQPKHDVAMQTINFSHPHVTTNEVIQLRKKWMFKMYLNPRFIFEQLLNIRSLKKIKDLFFLFNQIAFSKGKNRPDIPIT